MQQAIDNIMERSPENQDALTSHYRHFRNRFHFGREPQYTVTFQPLASKMLDSIVAVAGKKRFRNAQIHYDILNNLADELLKFPFDSWRKRPRRSVRRNLSTLPVDTRAAGRCFIDDMRVLPGQTRQGNKTTRAVDCLSEEFHLAKTGFAAEFLGRNYIRAAERSLENAVLKGDFSSPTHSKRVAVVMACAMFDS